MIKFLFYHIIKNFWRSFSLIFSVFLVVLIAFGAIYIFKNAESAISYYTMPSNEENRLTLSTSNNLLNIFVQENSLSENNIEEILANKNFENTQVFRLVNIPVSAKFGFFDFGLETDIPVFSVTDFALTGAEIPVWMSRVMLDVYNSQFAGSSKFFPQMRDFFLIGQKIEFTFGKSKIFASSNAIWEPITGTITKISNDFPGLGLILQESLVKNELSKIGFSLGNPYKVVTYVKNMDEKENIEKFFKAKNIVTNFEIDEIEKTRKKIQSIGLIVGTISAVIIAMIITFFGFLLSGFFRERKHLFRLIWLFDLKNIKSYLMTIGEPLILAVFGIIFGFIFIEFLGKFFHNYLSNFLDNQGILFPTIFPSFGEIFIIYGIIFIGIFIFIIILDIFAREKYKYF